MITEIPSYQAFLSLMSDLCHKFLSPKTGLVQKFFSLGSGLDQRFRTKTFSLAFPLPDLETDLNPD